MHRRFHTTARHSLAGWAVCLTAGLAVWPGSLAAAQGAREAEALLPLPPGTALPVALRSGMRAGRAAPGTPVVLRTTQRVPLAGHLYLKRGATLLGEVERSGPGEPAGQDVLRFHISALHYRGQTVPLAADATAAASFVAVAETRVPASGSTDRGNPNPASWTTRQVGGDEVVRSGWSGPVCDAVLQQVGFADYDGVYLQPAEASATPLALGPFSASASGLYGYHDGLRLSSAGGHITLRGPHGAVALRKGDAVLLLVVAPAADRAAQAPGTPMLPKPAPGACH